MSWWPAILAFPDRLLVTLAPQDVCLFRCLLEAHDNLAGFTTLEKKTALLKLFFAPGSRNEVVRVLRDIGRSVALEWREWPASDTSRHGET